MDSSAYMNCLCASHQELKLSFTFLRHFFQLNIMKGNLIDITKTDMSKLKD